MIAKHVAKERKRKTIYNKKNHTREKTFLGVIYKIRVTFKKTQKRPYKHTSYSYHKDKNNRKSCPIKKSQTGILGMEEISTEVEIPSKSEA